MSINYSAMLEIELIAMLLNKPTTVYAEHEGYVAPSIVILSAKEIDDLLDKDDYSTNYVGQCHICGEPLPRRIYSDSTEICNSCMTSLIG